MINNKILENSQNVLNVLNGLTQSEKAIVLSVVNSICEHEAQPQGQQGQ